MGQYLVLAAVVFGINLLPAFGPPTWAVLVLYRINSDLAAVPLVLVGAFAAASGRYVLARMSGRFRGRMSKKRLESLNALRDAFGDHRGRSVLALGLFALSPVPSAQLFVAAGLVAAPLLPLTAAFFAGRIVSYSIYVGVASVARNSVGGLFEQSFRSPLGIALQVIFLLLLVLLLRVDWVKVLGKVGIAPKASRVGGSVRTSTRRRQEEMENQPERLSDDEIRVRAEEKAAEAEAGQIGGKGSNEELDPADRAVREGGGGEAEGFEQAEDKLIENAGHGEGNPLPDEFSGEKESDLSGAEYGEPDELDPTER